MTKNDKNRQKSPKINNLGRFDRKMRFFEKKAARAKKWLTTRAMFGKIGSLSQCNQVTQGSL